MAELPGNILHVLDQAETTYLIFAGMVSSYYHKLIETGVHLELVEKLTIDFQNRLIDSVHGANTKEDNVE